MKIKNSTNYTGIRLTEAGSMVNVPTFLKSCVI